MATNLIDQHKNQNGVQVSECEDFGEGVVQAANTITPGMIVTKGTAAGEIIPDNDSGKAAGVALENMGITVGTVTDLRDDFAAGSRVRYGREIGFKFMGLIASGQNLTKDAKLKTAAGKLVAGTEGTDNIVATLVQEGGTGGALGADGYFLCKWGVVG